MSLLENKTLKKLISLKNNVNEIIANDERIFKKNFFKFY